MAPTYTCRCPGSIVPTAVLARHPVSPMLESKARLRTEALARRAAMTGPARAAASVWAATHAAAALPPQPGVVSVFLPIGDEIDTASLIEDLHGRGIPLALPVVVGRGRPLLFRRWSPGEPLAVRQMGLREPLDSAEPVAPDALICPLAVFDSRLNRIGYGAGYYDMTLAALRELKPVIAIGFAFACQEAAEVPTEPHDEPLDRIATEAGLIG